MIPFLKSVARAYSERYDDLSRILFLFPNKRSGTFFLKHLKEVLPSGRPVVAPDVMPIADFTSLVSGLVVTDRLNGIFLLYDCYRTLRGENASESRADGEEFEKFISWGEVILSDFSEIDLYLANAGEIFTNVKDYREISSDFLTEDQKRIMREYFGRDESTDAVAGFWKKFHEPDCESALKKRFIYLWQMMGPLYEALTDRLREHGLSTTGGNYRAALEALRQGGRGSLPWRKVVAVGFNALSGVEAAIFREMRKFEPYEDYDGDFIDFLWDGTGPVFASGSNSASKFLKANRKAFPSPEWTHPYISLSDTAEMPEYISVGASPSNSAQAKITGRILSDMRSRLPGSDFKDARVAVVLPDESLLMPLLYSIPSDIPEINLTMGYSMKLTAISSFMRLMRLGAASARKRRGGVTFYRRPLKALMAHPVAVAYVGKDAIDMLSSYIDSYNLVDISLTEVERVSPDFAPLLRPLAIGAEGGDVLGAVDELLGEIYLRMGNSASPMLKTKLEREHVALYRDAVRRLSDVVASYNVPLTGQTMFALVDRLLAAEKVQFEGEPLSGLQVMGTLETRALDFDCVIIPSMNERIMPMRVRGRTFIPDSLRRGYGLPPSNYAESLFSYYFYRLISRAKEVRLLYDARSSSGMRAGDVSRYIHQLRHLFAAGKLHEETWRFPLRKNEWRHADIVKTPDIMERLGAYLRAGSGKALSASTLDRYRQCQARFFYETVMGVNTDPEPSEYIDAIMQGEIVHRMLQDLYLPPEQQGRMLASPVDITAEMIGRLLSEEGHSELWRRMTRIVNAVYCRRREEALDTPLEGVARMVAGNMLGQVEGVLRKDLAIAPFRLYGVEISETMNLAKGDGTGVNYVCKIDRLDSVSVDGHEVMRVVDYKTGSIHMEFEDFAELFDGSYARKTVFQLFFYAWLLRHRDWGGSAPEYIGMEIYHIAKISSATRNVPVIGGKKVDDYAEYEKQFDSGLMEMVDSIFNPDEPFAMLEDVKECQKCALINICRK